MAKIPDSVASFVSQQLESPVQLELLVLLMESPDRWWDASSVATELRVTKDAARHALEELASRNLLAIRLTDDVHYQFQPGDDGLSQLMRAFKDSWRTNPVAIVQLLTERSHRSIRDFADAFRIRRDDDT